MNELVLEGCTPEPLMGYLKSLGVLRLVAEQADPAARGFWRDGVFVLETTLDRDGLAAFFLERYRPTPIVAPWAGGSGFFGSDNRTSVDAIVGSESARLAEFGALIRAVRAILEELGVTDKPVGETKDRLLREYRRKLPDRFVEWMDAALVVQDAGQSFPPLLGTGGNDGRLDFTQNYMQRLDALGFPKGKLVPQAAAWLGHALFGAAAPGMASAAVGQFAPGRAGGPNAGVGLEGPALVNPWDFVLLLEGTLLLGGAATRRMGVRRDRTAAFPFTVRAASVGYGSGADTEEADSRGEIWLPLWSSPTTASELRHVFSEGRADCNGRQSRDGLDFAQAVASLGVDRGFSSFVRYGFLKRSGKAFLAAPLGVFPVRERRTVDLVREVDGRLERLRRACAADEAPARFRSARRRIEAAIFDLCRFATDDDGAGWVQSLLRAFGATERELSVGSFARKPAAKGMTHPRIAPLGGLSAKWLTAADDGSAEFRLARAAAYSDAGLAGAIRRYLEPVEREKGYWAWGDGGGHVVWSGSDLSRNLGAVLIRRLMDTERGGDSEASPGDASDPEGSTSPRPFEKSRSRRSTYFPASLADIAAFLSGDVDETKLEELLWGLSLIESGGVSQFPHSDRDKPFELPRAYALMKLTLLSGPLKWKPDAQGKSALRVERPQKGEASTGTVVKPEPAMLARLRGGDVKGACEIAARRLRAAGFDLIGGFLANGSRRTIDWSADDTPAERLLAALLFPLPDSATNALAELVLRIPSQEKLT